MNKINNKGFLLSEAIIVAVFVMGMFSYLAINIFPLITKYDRALNYDNPNEVYNINFLYEELINKSIEPSTCAIKWKEKNIEDADSTEGFVAVPPWQECDKLKNEYFKTLLHDYLNIDYIVFYKNEIDNSSINSLDRNMREFYNYSKKNYGSSDTVMLVRFKYSSVNNVNDIDYKFSSIKVGE